MSKPVYWRRAFPLCVLALFATSCKKPSPEPKPQSSDDIPGAVDPVLPEGLFGSRFDEVKSALERSDMPSVETLLVREEWDAYVGDQRDELAQIARKRDQAEFLTHLSTIGIPAEDVATLVAACDWSAELARRLDSGALTPDQVLGEGMTALHAAAAANSTACIALLLERGADPLRESGGPQTFSPLHLAVLLSQEASVAAFIKAGVAMDDKALLLARNAVRLHGTPEADAILGMVEQALKVAPAGGSVAPSALSGS